MTPHQKLARLTALAQMQREAELARLSALAARQTRLSEKIAGLTEQRNAVLRQVCEKPQSGASMTTHLAYLDWRASRLTEAKAALTQDLETARAAAARAIGRHSVMERLMKRG